MDQPVTRGDLLEALAATKQELREALAATKQELRDDFAAGLTTTRQEIIDAVTGAIRDSQTGILKAYLPQQERTDLRFRTLEAKVSNVDTGLSGRVEIVERRLFEIEKRLLLNPSAA